MVAEGRKDNAEAQRAQSFAESERDSDGGLGTSCLPFFAAAK